MQPLADGIHAVGVMIYSCWLMRYTLSRDDMQPLADEIHAFGVMIYSRWLMRYTLLA